MKEKSMARISIVTAVAVVVTLGLSGFVFVGCTDSQPPDLKKQGERLAPSQIATKYDGKIVRQPSSGKGKDDGWYFVKDGKKRWISDPKWMRENGYSAEDVILLTSEEFLAIPEAEGTLQ